MRDEAASEREVRSKWGDWVGCWGGESVEEDVGVR